MITYKELQAATGETMVNLRQLAHIGQLPEPDGRIGISPYWNDNNPKIAEFIASRTAAKTEAAK